MESFDYQSQFERVKKDVAAAFTKALDVQADQTGLRLQAKEIWIDDTADSGDFDAQREAVRKDKTWGIPVYANLELTDRKTGKVISTQKRMKIATLPKATDFGSFIVDGKHYQVQNQLRRKPGIYITEKKNGESKAEINIAGRAFDVEYSPSSTIFRIARRGGGSEDKSGPALYPILSSMGVSDATMARAWGDQILAANKAASAKKGNEAVKKAAEYFVVDKVAAERRAKAGDTRPAFETADEAGKALRAYFDGTVLRPEVTQKTIGQAFTKVTPEAILTSAKELISAVAGKRAPDDRQSLEFKKVLSLSDLLRERLVKDNGELSPYLNEFRKKIHRKLNNQRSPPTAVGQVVSSGQFTPATTSFFTHSTLAHTPDQTNPIHMLNGMTKVTIMGEGGVGNDPQRVRAEERSVHPSQLGFIDPIHTPDSENIGLTMNLPVGISKRGDELETVVYDVKSKKNRKITAAEAANLTVSFADQFEDGVAIDKKVMAHVNGERRLVDAAKVDVVLRSPRQAFSIASNTIPFLPATMGVRAQMAAKMLEQAIPLTHREAPLVQVKAGGSTMERAIGTGFSVQAHEAGVVKSVTKHRVVVQTKDGEVEHGLYANFPLNNKAFLDSSPRVEVGQAVKAGEVLADSNFTDQGVMAMGTNLRAAYLPWKGYNFEDGIVITENARKKLTSEHMHQYSTMITGTTELGLDQFIAWNKGGLDDVTAAKLDKDGIVRKGQIVRRGDPLWVGTRENKNDPDYIAMRRLGATMSPKRSFAEEWTEDYDGEVVDVVRTGKKVKVYVRTREPAQIGDKVTNRFGGKGIITKIIADAEAPYAVNPDGTHAPVDILLNPHGITSRVNPSQMLETAAAKLALHQGKPYIVDNAITSKGGYAQQVSDELAAAGVSDTETLFDPHSKEPLGQVMVGPQYFLKLTKQATALYSARADGKYDAHGNPVSGGDEGAKALDLISTYAMLAHGARANLREMATYKATKNEPFWNWLAGGTGSGLMKPPPEPTLAYRKFENYLKAAGINVKRNGSKMVLQPMTDRDVEKISSGAVTAPQDGDPAKGGPVFVRAKDLKEEAGGLLDRTIFGGRDGHRWGHIDLAEAVPNPIFEKPIRQLTGLNEQQFKGLVAGKLWVDPKTGNFGDEKDPATVTSGEAVKALLSKINVDEQLGQWTEQAKQARTPEDLDKANKSLKYLSALKKLKVRPEDAYVQTKIPVLPPAFRPVIEMEDGTLSTPGLNTLYRDVALVNNELRWQNDTPFVPDAVSAPLREDLYNGIKAIAGVGQPIAYYPEARRPKGVIEQIRGKPAKTGFFQYEVLRRRQNLVGRGTIIPEPKLGVDEVGIPVEMAWTIFQPFVLRRLVNHSGMKPNDADEEWKKRSPAALAALQAEMAQHPVLLNRAPSLHKFSMMAFTPQLTEGRAIKIPPLVVKGFNADFDGDAMNVHVPLLEDAITEAYKMMPSRNLFNPGTGAIMIKPQNEAALGLYQISKDPKYKGALLKELPPALQEKYADQVLDGKGLDALMRDLAVALPRDHGKVVDKLKQMGDLHTYKTGFTVSLKDLLPNLPEKDKIFARTRKALGELRLETPEGRTAGTQVIDDANTELNAMLEADLPAQANNFDLMVRSGARGNRNQLKQIVSAPFAVPDHLGNPQMAPVMRSFAQGLPLSDYWATLYGARAAAVDKQLQTSAPGAFNKDIMATAITQVISQHDSGPQEGIPLPVDNRSNDLEDRFLSKDIRIGSTVIAHAGDQVTSSLLNTLRDRKVENVWVMSPLTDPTAHGISAKSYGINEHGKLPAIGDNVGAIAGQSLSEPLTQLTMRTFHQGGLSGTRGVVEGYAAIDKLFKMHEIKHGAAALAEESGKVERIEDVPGGGGKHIYISGAQAPVFVEQGLWDEKRVRVGTEVQRGDILSKGLAQPQELVRLKGSLPAQNYMVEEIHKAFAGQGVKLKRRAIETVIRAVGNTTRILDPGDGPFLAGDVAALTVVNAHNATKVGDLALNDALGHVVLEDDGAEIRKGDAFTDAMKTVLEHRGKRTVAVGPKKVVHEPFLSGIERVPMLRGDWLAQMGYRELAKSLVNGAATMSESDLHGYSPIPAFAFGAEFGDAPGGRSKKEGVY